MHNHNSGLPEVIVMQEDYPTGLKAFIALEGKSSESQRRGTGF